MWIQDWLDLLFLHWQVPAVAMRPHVPAPLEIDTRDGTAWVSAVIFRLRVRPRGLPFLPGLSELVEVNLRTYVRWRDKPGIWFLSVLADNRWAIRLARWLTPMPYVTAEMRYQRPDTPFRFSAQPSSLARPSLALTFTPGEANMEIVEGTLDAWLLERYRLFIQNRGQELLQAEVVHPRWVTRNVAVTISDNRMGESLGLPLSRVPDRAHFSEGVRAQFGAFRRVDTKRHNIDANRTPRAVSTSSAPRRP